MRIIKNKIINFVLSFRRSPRLRYLILDSGYRFLSSFEMTLLIFLCLSISENSFAQDKIDFDTCTIKDFPLNGKIQFVESFPDIKVQVVESFPDLKVKIVESFPDDCGEWQIVDSFPDVKIKVVDSFPDIKIKFVESFPGKP